MFKKLKFNSDARREMLKGINLLADAVKVTLGPKGNCVIIGDVNKQPRVTKDGVSVAKEVQLEDPFQNAGAQLIKEAATKMVSDVGDGTTTATILAQSMINSSLKALWFKCNPVDIKKGLDMALNIVLNYIEEHTIETSDELIRNIATISANNDESIGNLIADSFIKIGRDGVITIEQSSNSETSVKIINGMQFDKGYVAPHFVTDYVKDICVLENPYILITEQKVNRMKDLAFVLSQIVGENRSVLLIAEDYDDEVIEALKLNKMQGTLKVCAIKAPSFGEYRKDILDDLAVLTNGNNISYNSGLQLIDMKMSDLGQCNKVIVTKNDTTIIGGEGNVEERVKKLKADLEKLKNSPEFTGSFMFDFLSQRIAKLIGGICTIYVGGTTEIEMNERKDRVEDAVSATKAAIEEGIVAGGGLTYYNASKYLHNVHDKNLGVEFGIRILESALKEPFDIIVKNAGYNPKKLRKKLSETLGFDANSGIYTNMIDSGIIDPAKAAKMALKNSVSVTSLFLSTECMIVPSLVQLV